MDKPNQHNAKGKRRIKINNMPQNIGNKENLPKYEDHNGNPIR